MIRHSKRVAFVVVTPLAVVLALVLVPAGPASAGGPLVCAATGSVDTTPTGTGTYGWTVRGTGVCTGDFKGPYTVTLTGSGTSTMLGFCDNLIVRDLSIDTQIHLVSGLNQVGRTFDAHWFAPLTTYPIATPFLINDTGGSLIGAGALETRTRVQCAPKGAPTAVFEWTQLKS